MSSSDMNSSNKIVGLDVTFNRLKKTTEDEKKRIEEREKMIEVLYVFKTEIKEIKENMIPRNKMIEFFDDFDKFLNEFSHIEGCIQDQNAKSKLHNAVEEVRDTIVRINGWIKGN